jgi:pilus assembly protein Flp/PilA
MAKHQTRTEDGASAVEYGLMITGIAGVIVAGVFLFGGFVAGAFSHNCTVVADEFTAHGGSAQTCS